MSPEPRYREGNCHDCYYATDPRINEELSNSLRGQNVVVTGAGRGIGRAIAIFLTHASAKSLTIVALEQDELDETVALCKEVNPSLQTIARAMDATNTKAVRDLIQEVDNKFGGTDILVCNAGRPPQWLRTEECDADIWWDTLATSLQHAFLFTRFALPGMQARKRGCIVYTSSSGAHQSQFMGSYSLGKLGQIRLAELIHNENYAQFNITCFAYSPGAVRTRFFTDFEDKVKGNQAARNSYVESGVANQEKSAQTAYNVLKDVEFDTPELAAGLVTVLAAGKLNFMSGRYLDATVDIKEYFNHAEAITKQDLHRVRLHSSADVFLPIINS